MLSVNGVKWTKVNNAFLEYHGGTLYSVHRDAFDSHYILFSHDYLQLIPDNAVIRLQYNVTKGDINIPQSTKVVFAEQILLPDGTVMNDHMRYRLKSAFTGGFTDSDVYLDKAKTLRHAKSMDALITLDDIEGFLLGMPEIKSVYCSDISVNPYVIRPYEVFAYIALKSGESMSEPTRASIMSRLEERKLSKKEIVLYDAVKVLVNLEVHYKTFKPLVNYNELNNEITNLILSTYTNMDIKEPLFPEAIQSLILRSFPDIHSVTVTGISNPVPNLGEYYSVGDVVVTGGVYEY